MNRRALLWGPVLCLLVLGVVLAFPERKPPSFVLLARPVQFPGSVRGKVEAHIPAGWGWLWRLEEMLLGKRKPISILAEVFAISNSLSALAAAGVGPSGFSSEGIQVWLLAPKELVEMRERLSKSEGTQVTSRPRIGTADGIQAQMAVGAAVPVGACTNFTGLLFGTVAWLHPDRTDLSLSVMQSELVTNQPRSSPQAVSVETNFDAALRVQIPRGKGLFVLQQRLGAGHRAMALLIEPPQPIK